MIGFSHFVGIVNSVVTANICLYCYVVLIMLQNLHTLHVKSESALFESWKIPEGVTFTDLEQM